MADSIRDQLLGLGFKPAPKPEKPAQDPSRPRGERPAHERGAHNRGANERGSQDRGAHDRSSRERGAQDRGNDRSARDRNVNNRGANERGGNERGANDRAPGARPPHAGRPAHGQRPPHAGKPAHAGAPNQPGKSPHARGPQGAHKPRGEMDLAKAYAIRAQKEKDERIAAEKQRQEDAAKRREAKGKLVELLKTASLNVAEADIARHFEYGGKIRRVYVTADQLKAINAGDLAIVQQGGRYHVVTPQHANDAEALLPGALALLADPTVPSADDQYADPKYQVPDDLIW